MYRVGLPGWKIAARLGMPISFRVNVHKDEATGTYWAESSDLDGLVVSGEDFDHLQSEILSAAHSLLALSVAGHRAQAKANIVFSSAVPCAA